MEPSGLRQGFVQRERLVTAEAAGEPRWPLFSRFEAATGASGRARGPLSAARMPARSSLRAGRLPIAEARARRFGDATGKTLSGQRATPHAA